MPVRCGQQGHREMGSVLTAVMRVARRTTNGTTSGSLPSAPPATPPPATDQPLPEESPQAFHSAESSPAPTAKTAKGYALPTDSSEESDTQETAVNPSAPQTPVEQSPALALDTALAKLKTVQASLRRKEAALGVQDKQNLRHALKSPYYTHRMNARALKQRIRAKLRNRKFELDRVERPFRRKKAGRRLAV